MKVQAIRRWVMGTVAVCTLAIGAGARADEQNPLYKSWASHKAGTVVKLKSESEAAGNKTATEMTYTLQEVTPDKVVIEMKTVTEVGGQKIESPAMKQEIPAKGATAGKTDGKKPDADVKESEETVKVGGKDYKCKVREMTTKTGGMTANSKSWMSDDVPGMIVKSETKTEGQFAMTSKMELAEVTEK